MAPAALPGTVNQGALVGVPVMLELGFNSVGDLEQGSVQRNTCDDPVHGVPEGQEPKPQSRVEPAGDSQAEPLEADVSGLLACTACLACCCSFGCCIGSVMWCLNMGSKSPHTRFWANVNCGIAILSLVEVFLYCLFVHWGLIGDLGWEISLWEVAFFCCLIPPAMRAQRENEMF